MKRNKTEKQIISEYMSRITRNRKPWSTERAIELNRIRWSKKKAVDNSIDNPNGKDIL